LPIWTPQTFPAAQSKESPAFGLSSFSPPLNVTYIVPKSRLGGLYLELGLFFQLISSLPPLFPLVAIADHISLVSENLFKSSTFFFSMTPLQSPSSDFPPDLNLAPNGGAKLSALLTSIRSDR